MAVPTPALPTFANGQVTSAAQLNAIGSQASNLYTALHSGFRVRRPMCSVRINKENREILTATDTRTGWDAVDIDTDNMWSGVVSEPIRINTAGHWRVGLQIGMQPVTAAAGSVLAARIASFTSGTRSISTNSAAVSYAPMVSGVTSKVNVDIVLNLAAGVQLDFYVTHNAGVTAALDPQVGGCRAFALWLGPPVT